MLKLADGREVVLAGGRTDLRKGIDGLMEVVRNDLERDPCSGTLYLFCGRRADRIKGLIWEETGFLMVYMRIEDGHFKWPRDTTEALDISKEQYERLLNGLSVTEKSTINTFDTSRLI